MKSRMRRKLSRAMLLLCVTLLLSLLCGQIVLAEGSADATTEIEAAFYEADNWDCTGVALEAADSQNETLTFTLDATDNKIINGLAAYQPAEAREWSEYRFDAKVTAYKSDAGDYARTMFHIYSDGNNAAEQNSVGYQFRVTVENTANYTLQLYKIYKDADGNRQAKELGSCKVPAEGGTGYGDDSVSYDMGMQIHNGVITGFLNGTEAISYNTAMEDSTTGEPHAKGTVGFFLARISPTPYKVDFSELKVTEASGEAPVEEASTGFDYAHVEQIERVYEDDEKGNVIYSDNFDDYEPGDVGGWNWKDTDTGVGLWSIENGFLANKLEEPVYGTIALFDQNKYPFGTVEADVMITSSLENNVYVGPVAAHDMKSYYHLRIGDMADGTDRIQLYRMDMATANLLQNVTLDFPIERGKWYHMEMTLSEDGKIRGYLDGVQYIEYDVTGDDVVYTTGSAGVRCGQGSAIIDNFVLKVPEGGVKINHSIPYNETVVENPSTFTDDFEADTVAESPAYWLEKNTEDRWLVADAPDGSGKVYGVTGLSAEEKSATWLHVFETNVDLTSKLYVSSEGTAANGQAGLVIRLSGTEARVIVGYDYATEKWFVRDRKGLDFDEQTIWADSPSEFAMDTWHTVNVRAVGQSLKVTADGETVLETEEIGQVTTGRVGIYANGASCYVDDVELQLLSGQGRVEKAVLQNYVITPDIYSEGGVAFKYDDETMLFSGFQGGLYISHDEGDTFEPATQEEQKEFEFFVQPRAQHIRLHDGNIMKVDSYTGGKSYLYDFESKTYKQVGMMWDASKIEKKWDFYVGMSNMLKEVNLGDIDGDGEDNYRVFYCADVRAMGNPDGVGAITEHWEEIYYTDDCGYTWNRSQPSDMRWVSGMANLTESRIMAFDDKLIMFSTWNDSPTARYLVSYDHGETWEGEYALPQLRCAKASFDYVYDPDTGYYYVTFVYLDPGQNWGLPLRRRLSLIRTMDGENWEYVMDVWRWDDVPGDAASTINQVVDPAITLADDYIFVAAGWSESYNTTEYHNNLRQTLVKIRKSDITPYEEWPNDYTQPKDVVHIEVTAPDKLEYKVGEELDLTGGTITVYYYDGTTETVPMTDAGVKISEPDPSINYTSHFAAPDMSVAGEKYLRVDYATFADAFTINVVEELPQE